MLTASGAAGLTRRAGRRRANGSRGLRARRAWRRLVRECAAGDAAAQDAVRSIDLPEADVLDLLAVAPDQPADRAAFLTLIGQHAQRRALDPDGSLLALAYRAAAQGVRERLRATMAAGGDAEVIRVVITGDQRDRVAEMTHEELGYLRHQLAEHRRWDELRRLALDLTVTEAAETARLLPAGERTGPLARLAECSPERLQATLERLPREKRISWRYYDVRTALVAFSPDQTQLVIALERSSSVKRDINVNAITIASGARAPWLIRATWDDHQSILHLGDGIALTKAAPGSAITMVRRSSEFAIPPEGPELISNMARASTGAVAVTAAGLVFVDQSSIRRRHVTVPRLAKAPRDRWCRIATLPESRLIVVGCEDRVLVLDERGTVLHVKPVEAPRWMSFLTPDSLAVMAADRRWAIWRLSAPGGSWLNFDKAKGWRGIEALRGFPLDEQFAIALGEDDHHRFLAPDPLAPPVSGKPIGRNLVAVSRYADAIVTAPSAFSGLHSEQFVVHTPHLPAARELLETPLLNATPLHWRRWQELRARIGDPQIRDALGLFGDCLGQRFENDIALGTGPVSAGGPADIALGRGEPG